ncbi:uncharacterized protein LOC142341434 isoform X2 [Convolutriloba macropyga]|uniref:uncharacterized protein LOC142341434 isoform X2 n=1 Tax=Convolutriloba macropyga TaxID=536237 RepID=UPI003F5218B3
MIRIFQKCFQMDLELRKLRKKLRAIDRLETHSNLTVDEQNKLTLRPQIQARVAEILSEIQFHEPEKSVSSNNNLSNDDLGSGDTELDKKRKSVEVSAVNVQQMSQPDNGSERTSNSNSQPKKNPGASWKADVNLAELKKLKWKGRHMDGHNDTVFCIDSDGEYAITGSRDTMVKVWCLKTGEEIRTLLGHSGTVTCVKILPSSLEIRQVLAQLSNGEGSENQLERCCLTASTDCCIKLWNYLSGEMFKSIYTFGSVSSLCWVSAIPRMISSVNTSIISGSESGKLQIWDVVEANEVMSHKCHEESINKIEVNENVIFTSSKDGLVKIWQLNCDSEGCVTVNLQFVSDCLKRFPQSSGSDLKSRCSFGDIRAMVVDFDDQLIFVGDDGPNIKIVDWRNGFVHKLKNHDSAFGYTECLQLSAKFLFAAAYDIDTGTGSINVFCRPRKQNLNSLNQLYILTLSFAIDKMPALEVEGYLSTRVLAMIFSQLQSPHFSLIVGGQSLLSFRTDKTIFEHDFEIKSKVLQELARTSQIDSDHGTSDELFSSDDEIGFNVHDRSTRRYSGNGKRLQLTKVNDSYYSYLTGWCNLL